jgi:phenylpropionate dioxygenase-like ring-hydroxylating dioxygenase large terminal subunit
LGTSNSYTRLGTPWQLRSLVSTRRRRFEVGCNWKAFLEVFNEYYHLKYVHPDSIDGVYARPDPAEATLGAYASQFGETYGTGALLEDQQDHALPTMPGLEGRWAKGARYTWVFPNMTFAAGKESLWVYEAYPLGPHRCEVRQTICFPTDTLRRPDFEERSAHYTHRLDAALEEDVAALENQHKGLVSFRRARAVFGPHGAECRGLRQVVRGSIVSGDLTSSSYRLCLTTRRRGLCRR